MTSSLKAEKLKIVFMGTPEFAVPSLKVLLDNNYRIAAVVTAPDKPAGRGQILKASPVKKFALDNGLRLLQPDKLKDENFIKELTIIKPDLQVVVAFRILPEAVFTIPAFGTFNLHASLLPQYRGAAPINWVLINGEPETGLTTFFIDRNIDTGNILFQEKIKILNSDNAGTLHDKMMLMGSGLILKTIKMIESGNYHEIPQKGLLNDKLFFKSAPKIERHHCKIEWNKPGIEIFNLIRGLSPYPAAFSSLIKNEKSYNVKIFEAEFHNKPSAKTVGKIDSDNKNYVYVSVPDGYISIKLLQLEGKRKMLIKDFLSGFREINTYEML